MLEKILEKLPLMECRKILVYDIDDLFEDEAIIQEITSRGFQIIQYVDSEIFRYIYESEIRDGKRREKENNKYFVLVKKEAYVPYDIIQQFYCKRISLRDIFPKLSYVVVKEVYIDCIDRLYKVYQNYQGEELGDNGTKDYILKSVYGIYIELTENFMTLVKHLISIYYQGLSIPSLIGEYLIKQLSAKEKFCKYPIDKLVSSPHGFFQFMQSQWNLYINSLTRSELKKDILIDFNNHDIKAYVDNLFQENYMYPIKVNEALDVPIWMEAGVVYDTIEGLKKTVREKLNLIKEKLKDIKGYKEWFIISNLWSDVLVKFYEEKKLGDFFKDEVYSLKETLLTKFKDWMLTQYNKLHSLSYIKSPVVVHKIPWHIESQMKLNGYTKAALIVIDGMSIDDWKVIKGTISSEVNYEESLTYAWVPTMTSFSRQAIFSGEIPAHFGDTVLSTNFDEKHWKKFWIERGFEENNISYIRNIKTLQEEILMKKINSNHTKILGIVINAIDNFLHGAQLSTKEVHNSIKFWTEDVEFETFIRELLDKGYDTYITSDHGNIESIGVGKPREGLAVNTAGERVRIYNADFNSDNLMKDQLIKVKSF